MNLSTRNKDKLYTLTVNPIPTVTQCTIKDLNSYRYPLQKLKKCSLDTYNSY